MTTNRKFKVVVQKPRGPSYDLGDETYSLEREGLDAVADIVQADANTTEEYLAVARDADALIARFRRVSAPIIESLEKCVVIGCGSVGSDTVDVAAATKAGIVVTNVPDVFIDEVADHAIMLILASVRRLTLMDRMSRDGRWVDGRPAFADIPRLFGRSLGLISFGNVAKAVARRAQVFGLRVMSYDPYVSELTMTSAGVEPVSLEELLGRADIVSLHTPLNAETHHLMNAERFARMKKGSIFVNTGRGPCVDEKGLVPALERGQIAVAALDVLEEEPPAPDNPLLRMENVILTPHVASATSRMMPETRRRLGREIALVLRGYWPRSCVNPGVLPRTPLERWQPYPMERGPNR